MANAKKLPSGNWRVNLFVGMDPITEKRIYKSFTAPTKKEAEYMASEYLMTGKQKAAPAGDMTLREAYDRYIESKSNVLSPSTIREYRGCQRRSLQELMPKKLKDITQEDIQIAINKMAIDHSPKSVRNAHGLLSAVLNTYHPALQLYTRLPQKEKPDTVIPTEDEVNALLKAAEGKHLHRAILLAAVGTLRRSEICALTKADVFDNGVMINKAMVMNNDLDYVIKTTKTTAGTRFVELPKYVIDELKAVPGDRPDSRVYDYAPVTLSNMFAKLTKEVLGKSFRFHDLRHYSASVLHAMGVPDLYIMKRGGWDSRETLDRIYQHIMTDEQKKYNERIMDRFTDAFGK
jgi:integrase